MGEGGIIIHETSRKLAGLIASLFAVLATMAGGIITLARRPRTHGWKPPDTHKVPETDGTLLLLAMAVTLIALWAYTARRRSPHFPLEGGGNQA